MRQAGEQLAALTGWDLDEIHQKMKTERRLNALDYRGQTKLHQAISGHDLQAASALISQGANVNLFSPSQLPMSPLGEAIAFNQSEMVRLLLANGADVNARGWQGISMLQWAIVNADNHRGNNAGSNAGDNADALETDNLEPGSVATESLDVIQQLLDAGADVFAQTNQGATVLEYAQNSKNPELINLITSHMNVQALDPL